MKLNDLADVGATNLEDYYRKSLADPQNQGIDRYEAHFNLGLLAWRAGNVVAMNEHLGHTAREAIALVEARDPANREATRSPESVALPFLLAMNFGDTATKARLFALARSQWFQPENDEFKPLANLLDLLRGRFTGTRLDEAACAALLRLSDYPGTNLFYRPWVTTLTRGLLALAQRDQPAAESALRKLFELHEDIARDGAWRKLVEGLLSFWALTLQNVAELEGVPLTSKSPYTPR